MTLKVTKKNAPLLSTRVPDLPRLPLHINATSADTWVSSVARFPKYQTVFWGRSNGSTCFAKCEITCGSKLCFPTVWAAKPQRAAFYGMRRGIPGNQSSFDFGGRQIRELFVASKCSA
ncbi:hypothetical protein TcG_11524 [Trypanosoma cruzi]|nr:hypothetical protein TcG_11524 [Trypanosoma cruzi]